MLLLVALVEAVINRCVVPLTRPTEGMPPDWHTALDYVGLFSHYFTGALAVLVIIRRAIDAIDANRSLRDVLAHVAVGIAALVATAPLLVSTPPWTSFLLEITFSLAVIAMVASAFGHGRDLGIQIGLPILAAPLVFHTITVLTAQLVWPDMWDAPGGPATLFLELAVMMLAIAALSTPYCFAPRPFARAVARPIPIVVAMAVAAGGAIVARMMYSTLARATDLAIGIHMSPDADRKLALYLLAIATLAWTLTSCALASTKSRRMVGLGLGFVILGGYAFHWPQHYLLPLLGVSLIAEAAREVREQELDAMPFVVEAPPIADQTWSNFVGALAQGLRRTLADVHSLTTRGDHGLTSSVVVGEANGIPVRTRIERYHGAVIAIDVVVGREIDEVRGATFTVWAMPPRGSGVNPPGPPAAPIFRTGDAAFDGKFRARGNAIVFANMFDDGTQGRAVASLDGWLAYWEGEGLRYRVYPGKGAPLDHPVPLSDLALDRSGSPERLVTIVELLVEVGSRGLEPVAHTDGAGEHSDEPDHTDEESS